MSGKVLPFHSSTYPPKTKNLPKIIWGGFEFYGGGKNHVNGIESFWSFTKRRLAKFNGLTDEKLILHLKESEFRFNNRKGNLYKILLKIIRKNPLN